jgi:hypothetical protein
VSPSDPHTLGRRRADELLSLLGADDESAARLLDGVTEIRDLVFLGAGLTSIARAEARHLPPAQRAQANTRQLRLGELRDRSRTDPAGLRVWLRRAGEEIQLIRSQREIADRVHADDQEWTAARAAAEASGSDTASTPAAST